MCVEGKASFCDEMQKAVSSIRHLSYKVVGAKSFKKGRKVAFPISKANLRGGMGKEKRDF
jgi:hypothetical protein